MPFPPSAACRFFDLPPVNLQNLPLHLTKNSFASAPTHLCGIALEAKIACEKLAKPRLTEEQFMFFLQRFRKLDVTQPSHRKMLIDTFVNAIFLYDDKMVLTFNFREGTETITFADLQAALQRDENSLASVYERRNQTP